MLGAVPALAGQAQRMNTQRDSPPTRYCPHHSLQQTSRHLVYYLNQQFSTGGHSPQGTLAMSADTLVVMTGEESYWHLVGGAQGCCCASCRAQGTGQHHHRESSVP